MYYGIGGVVWSRGSSFYPARLGEEVVITTSSLRICVLTRPSCIYDLYVSNATVPYALGHGSGLVRLGSLRTFDSRP